ncbi:MAG: hypothetical protein H6814_03880 [Phycisphaeraceae bacterium]|nr:hypothetical protein [Phycisphaeraceae bacterium]
MLTPSEYQRIESEIASDASPVGIDAKKTHVMIIGMLESIERRLDKLESAAGAGGGITPGVRSIAESGVAALTDTFDDEVGRLRERGVDVDERGRRLLGLLEKLTEPGVLSALERLADLASQGPNAIAALTDTLDDEVARCAARGIDVDAAMRNGIAAILYLGQRISTAELESLGTLLRSDVLHPSAVGVVGQLGCALVAAAEAPTGSVGPFGAFSKLSNADAKRSTAFLLEFAKHFGAALDEGRRLGKASPNNEGDRA